VRSQAAFQNLAREAVREVAETASKLVPIVRRSPEGPAGASTPDGAKRALSAV
jgi:hypothetical protein